MFVNTLTGLHLLHPIMPHLTEVIWQGLMIAKSKDLHQDEPQTCLAQQSFPSSVWVNLFSIINNFFVILN